MGFLFKLLKLFPISSELLDVRESTELLPGHPAKLSPGDPSLRCLPFSAPPPLNDDCRPRKPRMNESKLVPAESDSESEVDSLITTESVKSTTKTQSIAFHFAVDISKGGISGLTQPQKISFLC